MTESRRAAVALSLLLSATAFLYTFSAMAGESTRRPVKLHSLIPRLDQSEPTDIKKLRLKARIQDTYNPSLVPIPKSGSTQAYEAGLKLFKQGNYGRAMQAFEQALSRAARYGAGDPRFKAARKAIDATKPKLTLRHKLGYDTDNKNKKALTGTVDKVFPPSLAWLGGLKRGDRILAGKNDGTSVRLRVQRGGKLYGLTLRLREESAVSLQKTASDKPPRAWRPKSRYGAQFGKIVKPDFLLSAEKQLAYYDCALLIDCSGSMGDRITFGRTGPGRYPTRWSWCRDQLVSFYRAGGRYFPDGIMLIPFNQRYAVATKARLHDIAEVFKQLTPGGGTNINQPLGYVIDDYFKRKSRAPGRVKRVAIAILSDGEGKATYLRDLIVKTTHRMTDPKEIVITFLGVDPSEEGRPVIEALDNDLIHAGAKYDIVDSRSFSELRRYGLLKMLVAALVERQVEGRE